MIKDLSGDKLTPLQAAKEIISGKLNNIMFDEVAESYQPDATAAERKAIIKHLSTLLTRMHKQLTWQKQQKKS